MRWRSTRSWVSWVRRRVSINNLGTFSYAEGRWDEAVELYQKSYDLRMRLGDAVDAAGSANNIAEVLSDQGHLDQARTRFENVLRVWRAADFGTGIGYALSNLGRVAYRDGRVVEAMELLDRARATFRQISAEPEVVETDARRAECLLLEGSGAEALALVDATLALARSLDSTYELPMLQRIRGFAELQLGDAGAARDAFEVSLTVARELDAVFDVALTLDAIVRLAVTQTGIVDVAARKEADALFTRLGVVRVLEVPLHAAADRDHEEVPL